MDVKAILGVKQAVDDGQARRADLATELVQALTRLLNISISVGKYMILTRTTCQTASETMTVWSTLPL